MNIISSTLSEGGVGYTVANENFFRLDAFAQFSIKDRDLTAPPGSPTEGDRYLVKATGTSAWAGHDGAVAIYHNSAWVFFTPQEGWQMWVDDEDRMLYYTGSAWDDFRPILDAFGRTMRSILPADKAGIQLSDGTAYFTYVGKTTRVETFNYVRFVVKTAASGTQTAEVGIFSSPAAPSRANQTITKIISTGTVDSLTTTGSKANTSAFAQVVPAGTHLWAGIRTSFTTLTPFITALIADKGHGRILSTASSGALTGAGPWTGALIADTSIVLAPDMEICIE